VNSLDIEVISQCAQWLDAGHRVTLATVIKTWGSSPRPIGAMLAVRGDGQLIGSVSGGCIEEDLVQRLREAGLAHRGPERVTYGVNAEEAHRFGLPCGGSIELILEPLDSNSLIGELLCRVQKRQLVRRSVDLRTGAVSLTDAAVGEVLAIDGQVLHSIHGPQWRLLVIGGGQLSRYLVEMAIPLDYLITVCDPREEHCVAWNIPGVTLTRDMPDDVVIAMKPDQRCAVVALTHDPKLDDMALIEALKSDAFYVGAIGSRLNNAKRRERLKLFDLSDDQVARLHGPIGLFIGSKTPPEIAVSVLAQIIAVRNGAQAKNPMAPLLQPPTQNGCIDL
jgi:xanthine dehydrogenase accessory factor